MNASVLLLAVLVAACGGSPAASPPVEPAATAAPSVTVLSVSEVQWEQLNPARGDASPKAATLWGDRNGSEATGFLFKPVDGFESPPHIHNVSYRGVVIHGLVHNDHPDAEQMWMPAGSFWTQPRGGVHITAAQQSDILAYIEIDEGPYLVRPIDQAFESGETPRNIMASDIDWREPSGASASGGGLRVAELWGHPRADGPAGLLAELAAGSTLTLRSADSTFRAVVIRGRPSHPAGEADAAMEPGSCLTAKGGPVEISCRAGEDCVLYVRHEGRLDLSVG